MKKIILIIGIFYFSTQFVYAHHSHASLNRNDIQQHRGTVKRFAWGMPHVFLKVMAPNSQGDVVEYTIEMLHPPGMIERGWERKTFKPGDQITWEGAADKNPERYFSGLNWAEKSDGTRMTMEKDVQPVAPSNDFTGLWVRSPRSGFSYTPPNDWPYTKIGRDMVAGFDEKKNPQIECQNPGPPKSTFLPYPIKISRPDDNTVTIDYELRDQLRIIPLDQEKTTGKPSKTGHSRGWFEDDVLVVETDGFIADRWGNHTGVDSSAQKHLVERFKLTDGGLSLEIQITITDPVYFTKPVVVDYYMNKIRDRDLVQSTCTLENARLFIEAGK
jgi:hypothetical protein